MVPKVFEPLKFGCMLVQQHTSTQNTRSYTIHNTAILEAVSEKLLLENHIVVFIAFQIFVATVLARRKGVHYFSTCNSIRIRSPNP